MITVMDRTFRAQLTDEDLDIIWFSRSPSSTSAKLKMREGDRLDADIFFAATDAAHDTDVPYTVSQIIRTL